MECYIISEINIYLKVLAKAYSQYKKNKLIKEILSKELK